MKNVYKVVKNYAVSVAVPVLLIVLVLLISPETRSWAAIWSLLKQGFAPAILGWGVLFNMKAGNWDFSIGARIVLTTIIAGNLAVDFNLGILGFTVLCIVISFIFGIIVGGAYLLLNIPTLMVSIGCMLLFESITRIIYGGRGIHFNSSYMILGNIPYNIIVFVLCFALATVLYYRRKYGYNVRAVGSNPIVAQANGIDARKTKAMAMVLSGLFVGLHAVLNMSTTGVTAAVPGTMGSAAAVFDAMMCVMIGMSICGKGSMIFAIYAGAISAQIIKMGMMAIGVPTTFNKVIIGTFVVVFMIASSRSDLFEKLGGIFRRKAEIKE